MKSLFFSYNMDVEKAYIIRVKGNDDSEKQALNCAVSCNKVGMPFQYWNAYNGISDEIIVPEHHNSIMKMIKVTPIIQLILVI